MPRRLTIKVLRRVPFEALESAADLITQGLKPGARARLAVFERCWIGESG